LKWRGEMEDTVTQEGTPPLYQQGRFPSVVDTDDLVFELGKQVVDRINKEKLLSISQIYNKRTNQEVKKICST